MNDNLKALPDCPYYLPCGHCDILVQRYKNVFDQEDKDVVCKMLEKPKNEKPKNIAYDVIAVYGVPKNEVDNSPEFMQELKIHLLQTMANCLLENMSVEELTDDNGAFVNFKGKIKVVEPPENDTLEKTNGITEAVTKGIKKFIGISEGEK